MSIADALISDERLAEIRLHVERGCSCAANVAAELIPEVDRLRSHNEYLTRMFYGIASWKVCERHNAVSIVDRARRDRVVDPSCQDCRSEDLAALVAGNPEATTMAERLRKAGARNLELAIENHRLRERLAEPAP